MTRKQLEAFGKIKSENILSRKEIIVLHFIMSVVESECFIIYVMSGKIDKTMKVWLYD